MSRLYIENVPSNLKQDEVRNLFEECGKLKYFNIQEGRGYIVK
jgi:RNA recognition motif-containing protein